MPPASARPSLSAVVVTYERHEHLRRCLASLGRLDEPAEQVVVVDASARPFAGDPGPGAVYVHAPALAGWMTRSRNEGLRHVTGDVVAFLDDDVEVSAGWARALRDAYLDPGVAAVAGRTRNGLPGEESYGEPVGRFRPDGTLTEGFASDPGRPVEVDHGIGANMSFRRAVLGRLGGFRDDYPGTALREDTDVFLRVRALGLRVVFVPEAVVDHRAAPHHTGARFDTRYKYYARRNHLVLLARATGTGSAETRAWVAGELRRAVRGEPLPAVRRAQRLLITLAGLAGGAVAAARSARWRPLPPERTGPAAEELRSLLLSR